MAKLSDARKRVVILEAEVARLKAANAALRKKIKEAGSGD